MNYTVYKALNNMANGTSSFNTTIGAVASNITAVDANYPLGSTQNVLTAIQGGYDGWTNNITTLGDGAFATTYANVSNSTAINFTKTDQWKHINANTSIPT